jgi:uncharacterized protein YggE
MKPLTFRRPLAIVLLAAFLGGCAALPAGTERTISVTGEGHAVVPPDTVTVSIGVSSTGDSIGPAVAENNASTEKVIQAVQALGVSPDDIQTTAFNVSSQVRYDEFGQPTQDVTYFVDNSVTVTLRDLSLLGRLLDDSLAAGANSIQNLSYGLGDPSAAEDLALSKALDAAQNQAQQLATSAGVTLGDLKSVTESATSPLPGARLAAEPGPKGVGVPTAAGSLEVTVQVSVTYGIR